jgi:peptide/nickel transport system substrate-binding protein
MRPTRARQWRAALLLVACALSQVHAQPAPPAAAVPLRGGTVFAIVQPEPTTLTSAINTQFPTGIVSVNIFDGLVRYDSNLAPQPSLALSWKVAPDAKSITFALRHGVKWHDGVEFTSADVRFSVLEVWKKVHPRGRSTFAAVENVETPDKYTAVLRLSQPAQVIMSALNSMEGQILPKHLYEGTDIVKNPNNLKPVGTGPFRFKDWKRGQYIELVRNPDYWDQGKPYVDRLIFRVIPDAATRAAALETGEVQYAPYSPVPLADVERLRANPELAIETRGYAWVAPYFLLEFNLRNPILNQLKVRQAIAHAIDRKGLVNTVWYGMGKPATGPVPSSLANFYEPGVTEYEFSPARAEKLLDEAGYPRQAGGMRFSLKHSYMPFGEIYQNTSEYLRQNLKRVGIDLVVRNQDLGAYVKRVYTDYDFDTNGVQISAFMDPQIGIHRQFWSKAIAPGTPWVNASGYSNPRVDQVIEASQIEATPARRIALFRQLQRLVVADLPVLPLFEMRHFTVYNRKLHGIGTDPDAGLSSLKNVWLAR